VLLRVNDAGAARQLQRVFDAGMAPDVLSWQLSGDATWTRTGGRDSQRELLATRGENAG
jgi:polyphosphate kinase